MLRRMKNVLAAWLAVSASIAVASGWDIPPPPRGQWALDRTGMVSSGTIAELNRIAEGVDASGAGQLGVLIVSSTDGTKPRDFATGVFNSWGVGHAGTNDGILLFVAVADRKAEIILGDGSKVSSAQTDAVMANDVVANMKRSDLDGALRSAARSLDDLMRRAAGTAPAPHPSDNQGLGPDAYVTPIQATPLLDDVLAPYADGSKSFPERSPRTWVVDLSDVLSASQRAQLDVAASDIYSADKGRIFFLLVNSTAEYPSISELARHLVLQAGPISRLPVAVIALDVGSSRVSIQVPDSVVRTGWERQELGRVEQELRQASSVDRIAGLLSAQRFVQQALTTGIPARPMSQVLAQGLERNKGTLQLGGGGLLVVGLLLGRRWNRKRVRTCEGCKHPRQLLGDVEEDQHLGTSQLKEESIGSVDYDVWWCGRCEDVLVLRYGTIFTSYSNCPGCNAKTKSSSTTTLSYATEYSTGLQQIDERCANCSYTNSYTRTTARLSSSSDSSSSWSSSSSGSSFGGGSSSGGGSSGSW